MLQAVLFVIILLIENQVMCMQKDRAQKRRDLKGRIMLIHIKNENETAAIDTLGAELVSFMGDDGFEHIWQGDKTYWGGHAPVLFPIVGALRDNRTCINGEWYEMKRHGVARHEEFTITEQGEDYVTLQLTANEETKKQYPFDFVLTVSYYLTGSSITTKFTVKNADTKPMPFCIGGHPGFNIPIQSDEIFEDYDIVFEEKEDQKCPTLDMESCLIDFEKTNFELDDTDTIPLQHSLFYKDALVFENLNSTCVSLKSRQSGRGVMMEFSGFPMLGIWSAANDGPYVALEPWTGCATAVQEDDVFEKKHGMRTLQPGEEAEYAYTVFEI